MTRPSSERVALVVFGVFVAAAVPIVLFGIGDYHWFFRDDWYFLTGRSARSLDDLLRPHNAHWSTVPVLAFRGLWAAFGLRSYVPYQATVLALHLTTAVLVRFVMRRAGVSPWVATATASAFVLFGPGAQNITWAFQIGFVGALVFGIVHGLLADHDGPLDRRDALGLGAGVLALMSSGVGVAMVGVVGLATLLRRGWRIALVHLAPLAALYVAWALIEEPKQADFIGRPTAGTLLKWVVNSEIGTFEALGHFGIVAIALVVLLVGGAVVARTDSSGREFLRRWALPIGMVAGGVAFATFSGWGRAALSDELAKSSRYIYIIAALTLPALALAAEAVVRRWRLALPAVIALLVVAIPWNATDFERGIFGPGYFDNEERILTTVVRIPFAQDVPRDVRPIPDVYLSEDLTIGFLLDAMDAGKLEPSTDPITPAEANEMRVRLGIAQRIERRFPTGCRKIEGTYDVAPERGTVFRIGSPVSISTRRGDQVTSAPVGFVPRDGIKLVVTLDGLALRFGPALGASEFTLCS